MCPSRQQPSAHGTATFGAPPVLARLRVAATLWLRACAATRVQHGEAAPWLPLARRGGWTQRVGVISRLPLLNPRSTEDAQRIPGIGPACAALVDDAFRRLRAAAGRTRQPRAPPAASPNPPTAGKRKRKASNDTPPLCRYCTAAGGEGCYQKNPDHMAKFTHA